MESNVFKYQVTGDTMSPTYEAGDVILCRPFDKSKSIICEGKVYLLDTEQGKILCRLYADKNDDKTLFCDVDNKSIYQGFKIPQRAVYGLYEVSKITVRSL